MKLPHRRQFLHLAAGAAAVPALPRIARSQAYPTRPVRVIVPFPPGGAADTLGRLLSQWISERLGQQFIVENRPGAGTNIGTELVVRAAPDGYTLLVVDGSPAVNATLYQKLNFNFIRDVEPIASIARQPMVIVVNPSFPAKTLPELLAYARANPGKINMASAGVGSPTHISGELFQSMTGVTMAHVPYRGAAPALTDLLGGQVQLMFSGMIISVEHIKAGRLRALAVTTAARAEVLPDIPVVSDFIPGYEASIWYGVGAPKKTPLHVIDRLNKAINGALGNSTIKARIGDLGGAVLPGTPAEFSTLIADETEKWGKVIRAANVKPE
jgi:tripartite-type tricarboxylate transporter receptor subunit TctC